MRDEIRSQVLVHTTHGMRQLKAAVERMKHLVRRPVHML